MAMDPVQMFGRAAEGAVVVIERIPPDGWAAPTPCTEWDVRALVNHVTYEQLWAPHLLAGETVEQVGDRYEGDVLGTEPLATTRAASATSVAAFAGTDLDAIVHLSYADVPCREYLSQMLTDAEVHGWDLATATGQDRTLDEAVVAAVLPAMREQEALIRASGMFGESQPVPDDADDATRLLALLGRRSER